MVLANEEATLEEVQAAAKALADAVAALEDAKEVELTVESVSAINNNGVTVTFPALTGDVTEETVEVKDPSGKVIPVVAKTVLKGATSTTFLFAEPLTSVIGGTWTVDGVAVEVEGNNTNLTSLAFNTGNLDKEFDAKLATQTYTLSVDKDVKELDLTAVLEDATSTMTVTVGSNTVALSNNSVKKIQLDASGTTTVVVTVYPKSGTAKTYTVTVKNATGLESNDSALKSTTTIPGVLGTFVSNKFNYEGTVPTGTTSVTFAPVVQDSNATAVVYLNGKKLDTAASYTTNLEIGKNTIEIVVTAQDGVTKSTYKFDVTRVAATASPDATLAGTKLDVNAGTITEWSSDAATLSIASDVETLTIAPVTNHVKAKVSVKAYQADGSTEVANAVKDNGNGTFTIAKEAVVNTYKFKVTVTAEDASTTKPYTVTINKALATANDNVNLSTFTLGGNAVKDGDVVNVANTQTTLPALVATVADTGKAAAKFKVNGIDVAQANLATTPLKVGSNKVEVIVTAEDNKTVKTYTLTVNRAALTASEDNKLKDASLKVSAGSISAWDTNGKANLSLTASVEEVTITPTTNDSKATVSVKAYQADGTTEVANAVKDNGNGTFTIAKAAVVDTYKFKVTVTAENAVAKTYEVTIAKASASANDDVSLSTFTLAGNAVKDGETVKVPNGTTALGTLVATATDSTKATVSYKVNGADVAQANLATTLLKVGDNTVEVTVLAENKVAKKTYKLTVNRASAQAGKEAGLTGLTVDKGALVLDADGLATTVTSGNVTEAVGLNITSDVNSVVINPALADAKATISAVKANDSATPVSIVPNADGTYTVASLDNGDKFVLTVTSENTEVTYAVTVTVKKAATTASKEVKLDGIKYGVSTSTAVTADKAVKDGDSIVVANAEKKFNLAIDPLDSEAVYSSSASLKQTITVKHNGTVVGTSVTGTAVNNVVAKLTADADLVIGDNKFEVIVVAEDGTTTATNTFTVKRLSSVYSVEAKLGADALVSGTAKDVANGFEVDTTTSKTKEQVANIALTLASSTATIKNVTAIQVDDVKVLTSTVEGSNIKVNIPAGLNAKDVTVKFTVEDQGLTKEYTVVLKAPAAGGGI